MIFNSYVVLRSLVLFVCLVGDAGAILGQRGPIGTKGYRLAQAPLWETAYNAFMFQISGGPNKQIPQNRLSGGQKFGLTAQQPAQIQKAQINITACKFLSESCHIHILHSLFV